MIDTHESAGSNKKSKVFKLLNLHETWPVFSTTAVSPFQNPGTWFTLNMLVISSIFWNDGTFHAEELAICFGIMHIIGAFSKLLFGTLADKHSRKILVAIAHGGSSLGIFLCGFVPPGLGSTSFFIFLAFIIFRECFTAETPVLVSFIDDVVDENKRSQFFGLRDMLGQFVTIFAMIICASIFQGYWPQYFWCVGLVGIAGAIIIVVKGKEPKRGAQRNELRNILKLDSAVYKYKLNKDTIKATIFSPTNMLALVEGLFTQIVVAIPLFLAYPYLESAPFNISAFNMSLIAVLFGVPGLIVGSTIFSKISDDYGKKDIKNRVKIIFASLVFFCGAFLVVFLLPLEGMDASEGSNLISILSHGMYWILGILYFFSQVFFCLYFVNQRPILQKINLPEAQGAMASANSFLEILSSGIGVIIAGSLLVAFNNSYQLTVLTLVLIGLGGTTFWLFCFKYIDKDVARVSNILKERAKLMGG
jgi:MFS family permease